MKKLWQKGNVKLNSFLEEFETKDDLIFDQKLVTFDVLASLAHAKMLQKIGILNKKELSELEKGLQEILELDKKGQFKLTMGDEDIHTKIENYLTEKYGEVGKKIHTGRSRNDQVLTVMRLYAKEQLKLITHEVLEFKKSFTAFSKTYGFVQMPGYTHMQKAMPSTLGLWADSFIDSLADDQVQFLAVQKLIDQSPLGSAAGYGVPFDVDREYTAKLLGFAKVQKNSLYCQNSRTKFDAAVVSVLVQLLLTINKFASDVMLFSTSEFGFFTVSDSVTTGSSMMPQKKNVDVAELLRSKVHVVLGNYVQIVSLSSNLISGYNRDFQDSKKSFMESFDITLASIKAAQILLNNLTPNKEVLKKAMTEDLYMTQKAFDLVKKGMSFRDAYKKVKPSFAKVSEGKGGEKI